jgi:hypothetical protein
MVYENIIFFSELKIIEFFPAYSWMPILINK